MNKKQYNNVIEHTLKHDLASQTEDSLEIARAIFSNMGVALPQGDIKSVYEIIKSDDYMGWKHCTMQEAQEAADNGTAAIGVSEDRIVVLAAKDEEEPVAESSTVMTISKSTRDEGLEYYVYSNTTTAALTVNGWLKLYTSPSIIGRIVTMPEGCDPEKWYAFEGLSTINYYALDAIGDTNSVIVGDQGELYDNSGRYWVAVGPKVMNPNHADDKMVYAEEMRYGSKLDVLLQHKVSGRIYYLRAVVGDCKNHTYSNGIYQTGRSFPNGDEYYEQHNDGSVIEFCGAVLREGLSNFKIVYIMVQN